MKRSVFLGFLIALVATSTSAQSNFNYGSALDAAIKFFDANRCGPDAGKDNAFSWRGACHTGDEVTGGYHDAGDHVKFGLPQCWSAAVLGWAMYEFPSVFEPRKDRYFRMMKWFTDYFLKCHSGTGVFIHTIGDGNADHGYWGSPEGQGNSSRPVVKAPPGSDVCGEAAAALALMYLNYKSVDGGYAARCLDAAKDLYAMAVAGIGSKVTGRCSDGSGGNFYNSSSHYDDVIWAGIWLYTATGDVKYLDNIDTWIQIPNDPGDNPFQKRWAPAWDDVTMFNLLKMAEITGNETYYKGVLFNLDWFKNDVTKSPYGLPVLSSWAPLRYASAEAGLGFMTYRLLGYEGFNPMGNFIIDYCLGKNKENRSYLTGWGNNPPVHPHHRANEPTRGGATKGIVGALVGGPSDDSYEDNVNNYVETEVALDYNASFIFGLAGDMYFKNGGKAKNRGPSVSIVSPLNNISIPAGAEITVRVAANDADGKVTKIDLYKGDQLLKSGTTSPLLYKLNNSSTEDIILKASATDDSGHVTKSRTVTLHFTAPDVPGKMQSRTGWVATASSNSPNANEGYLSALDGDPATRWTSGTAMTKGMWFLLDMGFPRKFDEMVLDASGSGSDFPRRFTMYAGNDTGNLGNPVATDSGAQVKVVELSRPITAQYVRLVCEEGQGGSWWSIHELNVPCAGSSVHLRTTAGSSKVQQLTIDAAVQGTSVLVSYSIPERGRVIIEEYVLNGKRTNVLFDGFRAAGNYSFTRSIGCSGSKIALVKICSGGSSLLKRVMIVE